MTTIWIGMDQPVMKLSIARLLSVNRKIVYVGETSNERSRVIAYASHGSHLSKIIKFQLNKDWILYYRAQIKNSKEEAIETQNNILIKFNYDWNIQLNCN